MVKMINNIIDINLNDFEMANAVPSTDLINRKYIFIKNDNKLKNIKKSESALIS